MYLKSSSSMKSFVSKDDLQPTHQAMNAVGGDEIQKASTKFSKVKQDGQWKINNYYVDNLYAQSKKKTNMFWNSESPFNSRLLVIQYSVNSVKGRETSA